ncbi:MAG TPA: alkaline phosphatase family protein [Micropepsaceae bacterium]|nr:alkaline phosphatase family protein [Micropepsaceae bacterium]
MIKRYLVALAAVAAVATVTADAAERQTPRGTFGKLDHVFFIMMENETNTNIIGSASAPFINSYAGVANQATSYFAVGHPSAPNYLEVTGGSNFGVSNDFWPNWNDGGCVDNAPGSSGCNNAVNPIASAGRDNAVVQTATSSSQCNGQVTISGTPTPFNCALYDYPSTFYTPKSIADQLVAKKKSWKSYQESLPIVVPGADGINYSDGAFSNLSPVADFAPGPIQKLYAVKHNPFAYFQNIQIGDNPNLSLGRITDFDGPDGLWADLQSGNAPNFAFIVPNQCHDMHGFVAGGPPICSSATPAESALLMSEGDAEVKKLVTGIKSSKAWQKGRNAIVVVWDENDFSNSPNHVVMLVETNYAPNGHVSATPYDHYSLLRTLEAGFELPCLNHACDATSAVMNDMFGGQ